MKTVIITGTSTGIGFELAKIFSKKNYNVISLSRSSNVVNIGSKNSLTSAVVLDDGRVAISGNGGVVSIIDLVKKMNIETCVRSDRLSNTSIIPLGSDEFLIAGEKGVRKHSMSQCYQNFVTKENNSQDSYIEVKIN